MNGPEFPSHSEESFGSEEVEAAPRSTLKDLTVLAGIEKSYQTGEIGPLVASRATPEGKKVPELSAYESVYGRDSLHAAYDLLEYYPKLAESTLELLAKLQGTKSDNITEEEPGRIHHEYRQEGDPYLEKLQAIWGHPGDKELIYYGTVDATTLYVKLFSEYLESTGNWDFLDRKVENKDGEEIDLKSALVKAVEWISKRTDRSDLGFVEYQRSNPNGLWNQIRKDSWDGLSHEDGTLPNHNSPIAAVEVQGYAYDALVGAAKVFERFAEHDASWQKRVEECHQRANTIKENLIKHLWMEDKQYFAIGVDRGEGGQERQIRTITSNVGHLLNSGILNGQDMQHYREAIIQRLFLPDMFCVAGIRSLSSQEKRYSPGAYSNGSVWPMDNEMIAKGLERKGYLALATEVRLRSHWAAFVVRKNAEFFRGDDGTDGEGNPIPQINTRLIKEFSAERGEEIKVERPPQEIQAWTVTPILSTKRKLGEGLMKKVRDRHKVEFEESVLEDLRTSRPEGLLVEKDLKELFKFRKQ